MSSTNPGHTGTVISAVDWRFLMLRELMEIDESLDRVREMCSADLSIPHGVYQAILESQKRLFGLIDRMKKEFQNADN
jgi:hypothetical protein